MSLARILDLELLGILYALIGAVTFQLLTRRINLYGLLSRKDGSGTVSPERIQLLLATIAASARYLDEVAKNQTGNMPDINSSWLYLFGGSSGIYAFGKAWALWKETKRN
jgi:hypothetical protein